MTAVNTKTSLDTMFKRAVAPKVDRLMPQSAILQRLLPAIESSAKLGREYLQPVALTFEHGITYGDETAFTLANPVAGVYTEAKVTSNPVILRSQVSQSAANRLANDEKAFLSWAGLRSEVMKSSIAKRAELAMLYGRRGIATVESTTDGGTDVATIKITAATWSAAIWGGMERAVLQVFQSDLTTGRANAVTVTSVNPETREIVVAGTEAELDAIVAGDVIFFSGSNPNGTSTYAGQDMAGVDRILTNSGALFDINATTYQLWKASSYSVAGALTFGKVLKAAALGVNKGGLEGEISLLVNPDVFEQLNSDYASYRATDSSYKASKGELGVEALDFHYQAGLIKIMPHPFVKTGDGFMVQPDAWKRIGATDITFNTGVDGEGSFFLPLASQAGYELRCQYDYAVFCQFPGKQIKLSGITVS
jgi:hypothetical protein